MYNSKFYSKPPFNDPVIRLDPLSFGSCDDVFEPNIVTYEELWKISMDKKVFICSTFELFHPQVPKEWRDGIFQAIIDNPQITFQILTKMPENIDRPMPDNVWLGVSITGNTIQDNIRADYFGFKPRKARIQFISYEPLLEMPCYNIPNVDWIIIGKLTGHGNKYNPKKEWIEKIITSGEAMSKSIFMKDNLRDILGANLIQRFPE